MRFADIADACAAAGVTVTHRAGGTHASSDPARVHRDATALQSHGEPDVRHTGLGLLAQRTHPV